MSAMIITTRTKIRELPERYAYQYANKYGMLVGAGPTAGEVLAKLHALDRETATVEDLSKIAAYLPGWVEIRCGSCHMSVPSAIIVGDLNSDDHEAAEITLCRRCLDEAVTVADKGRSHE